MKATAVKTAILSEIAAKFSRSGRILVVKEKNGVFYSNTVIEWPIFLKVIRIDQNVTYNILIENQNPSPFLNSRTFTALFKSQT